MSNELLLDSTVSEEVTLLLDATVADEVTVLLDFGVTLEEEAISTLLLESSFWAEEELFLSPPTELEEFLVVAEELDSFVLFSLEEDLSLSAFFCELEEFLETSSLLLETSAIGSGSVLLEPLSHAVNTAKARAMARSMDSLRFASRMTGQE